MSIALPSPQFLHNEQQHFEAEVASVKKWWASSRWAHTKRPFVAEDVVAKRGSLVQGFASDTQAKKCWSLLKDHRSKGSASFTFGALDPVQVVQMSKYLDTIYVSGWQCSSTASTTNEPGPDLAD